MMRTQTHSAHAQTGVVCQSQKHPVLVTAIVWWTTTVLQSSPCIEQSSKMINQTGVALQVRQEM